LEPEGLTAHTIRDKKKLLSRVRRLRGQIEAVERALDEERPCTDVLQIVAACRGAINGLMAELLEGHIRYHVIEADGKLSSEQTQAAEELIDVLRSYLR
jgi:FrmR/RcnR family transcriptional regulator, repressor of frmRAB operon